MFAQRHDDVDYVGLVVEMLTSLKRFLKFKELEKILGIPIPTLWRYIHGDIKPGQDRAKSMLYRLLSRDVVEAIMGRILKVSDGDIVNLYSVAYNIDVLTYASIDAFLWGRNMMPTSVVTVEVDGIAFATMVAKRLNAKLVVVKKKKEVGFDKFIELSYLAAMPPEVVTLYLPEDVLDHNDRVLIVDDIVRSGRTTKAVCELVKKSGAKITGFYALIGVSTTWSKAVEECVGSNYRILYRLEPSSAESTP